MLEGVENRSEPMHKASRTAKEIAQILIEHGTGEASVILNFVINILCESYECRQIELAKEIEFLKQEVDTLSRCKFG